MKALLGVVVALLLVVGSIAAVLKYSGSAAVKPPADLALGDARLGRQVALRPDVNCVLCHSDDGANMQGPSFKGLWGSVVKYDDGSTGLIDDAAVREALKHPVEKLIDGFEPRMPELDSKLTEEDKLNLLAYLRSIGAGT